MSKDKDNPFAQLDIRRFPQARPAGKARKSNAMHSARPDPPDEDSDLFLNALGDGVQAYGKAGGRRKAAASAKNGKVAERHGQEDFLDKERGEEQGGTKLKEKFNVVLARKASEGCVLPGKNEVDGPQGKDGGRLPSSILPESRGVDLSGVASDQDEAEAGDELAQFMMAVKGATPLHVRGRDVPLEAKGELPLPGRQTNPMQDAMEGPLEFAVCCRDEYAEGHVLGLDPMLLEQLKARQFSPEAHIDLHGLNADQAYWNLLGFFRGAYFKGLRVAVVVTGRGLNSPSGIPVLKMHVQQWMTQEPLKRVVLAFCSARQEDGGTGAFYVLLRKRKKSAGKISWDKTPPDAGFS